MNKCLLGDYAGLTDSELLDLVVSDFKVDKAEYELYNILLAWRDSGTGYGHREVYFIVQSRDTGELYEITANCCSCDGLEGQWVPVRTSMAYLCSQNYYWRTYPEMVEFINNFRGLNPNDC
jgi:hypothetical protein